MAEYDWRYCVNCKHYNDGLRTPYCSKEFKALDLVSGHRVYNRYCSDMRGNERYCGAFAFGFESKHKEATK